jgi:hypothetical protein
MDAAGVTLYCLGGFQPGPDAVQEDTQTVDLQRPRSFVAWLQIGYIGGRGTTPWDFDNAIAGEVFSVDGAIQPSEVWLGRFGAPGAFTNYHRVAVRGVGQRITFRLRVFQPDEMEAHGTGIVLFDI